MTARDSSELAALDAENVMQTYGRLPVAFVRGEGTKLWDSEGKRVSRLPRRASRSRRSATRTPRSPTRSPTRRARCCTFRTSITTTCSRRSPRGSTRCSAAADACSSRNSGAEANECAIKLARRYGQTQRRARALPRDQRVRLVPRPHAHDARGDRPAAEAGDVPAAARRASVRSRSTISTRSTAALDDRVAAVMLEAGAGRGRRGARRRPSTCTACAGCATSARRCSSSTRCSAGSAVPARWFGVRARRHRARRRHDGQGARATACRSARAGPAPRSRPRSLPGDHATTFGGQPLAARAALATLDGHGARARSRSARRAPGARLVGGACRRSTASPTYAAPGCSIAAELAPGLDAKAVAQTLSRRRARAQRGHAERAAARAVAARHRRRDRRSGRDHRRRLRDESANAVSRLVPRSRRSRSGAAPTRSSTTRSRGRPIPAQVPPVLAGPGRRRAVREAVGPHPDLDRDGGRDARRAPDLHPRRGGRPRRARVGRGRRPHDGRHVRGDRGARLRPPHARAHGGRGRRADRQPPVRPRASVPGARRPADAARALRPARRPADRVRRRRQQRRRVARVRRRRSRASSSWSRRPRATSSTPTSSTAPAISAARSS